MMTSWHREAPVPAAGSTSIVELAMNKLVPTTVSSRSTVLIWRTIHSVRSGATAAQSDAGLCGAGVERCAKSRSGIIGMHTVSPQHARLLCSGRPGHDTQARLPSSKRNQQPVSGGERLTFHGWRSDSCPYCAAVRPALRSDIRTAASSPVRHGSSFVRGPLRRPHGQRECWRRRGCSSRRGAADFRAYSDRPPGNAFSSKDCCPSDKLSPTRSSMPWRRSPADSSAIPPTQCWIGHDQTPARRAGSMTTGALSPWLPLHRVLRQAHPDVNPRGLSRIGRW